MSFAPQRPQSIYGRAQVPNTSGGINWAMGAQTSIGPALAALGSMVGQRRKEAAILEQQAKEREAARALQQQSMALQQQRAGMAQAKFNLEASEYAANQKAARDLQAEKIAAAQWERKLAEAEFGLVQDAATADEARNTAIDARFARGEQAIAEADLFQFLGPAQGGGTLEQWEAANPIKARDRNFSLSDWAIYHGDPNVSTSAEEVNAYHRLNAPVRTTPGGNTFMQNAAGSWIEVDKAAQPVQKSAEQQQAERERTDIELGNYRGPIEKDADIWETKETKDLTENTITLSKHLKDRPALMRQTRYKVAEHTLTNLPSGPAQTAFKAAFANKDKGVRLTEVDKQVFDLDGDGKLEVNEKSFATKIRAKQAVETLQQLGHEMYQNKDAKGNVPQMVTPEGEIYGDEIPDREQWFKMMRVKDPYEWDDTANQGQGGWVIAQRTTAPSTVFVPSVNIPLIGPVGGKTTQIPHTGPPRRMTEAEFFETTHPQSQATIPGTNVRFVQRFRPIR